ncbi:MAG: GntR family transcriptional regulator [Desulfohalobiaceae bacterium]|nr:GntR family transcriptional regulator [Desulfohalobiaceae bacterium]
MSHVFDKQERPTLMNQALKQIKGAIRDGRVKPGDRLIETELAKDMGISRFPIREALRQLEKEGLVQSVPFKGTSVARFSRKDIEDLYNLRGALEGLAVRTLVKNITAAEIKKLQTIVKAMIKAGEENKGRKIIEEDMRFHKRLCELSGNEKLLTVWLTLESQSRIFLTFERFQYTDLKSFIKWHVEILEALKKRDGDLAEQVVLKHLAEGLELMRSGYLED